MSNFARQVFSSVWLHFFAARHDGTWEALGPELKKVDMSKRGKGRRGGLRLSVASKDINLKTPISKSQNLPVV